MEIELLNPVLAFRGLSDEDQEDEVEIADNNDDEKGLDDDKAEDDDEEEEVDPLVTEE